METKLINICEACTALKSILQANDMPFFLTWQFEDIINACKTHVKRYETEQKKLLEKYGVCTDEVKGFYKIEPENIESYKTDLSQLNDCIIDLNIKPLNKADIKTLIVPKASNITALNDFLLCE